MTSLNKHPLEDSDSWESLLTRHGIEEGAVEQPVEQRRYLKHHHYDLSADELEREKEDQFWQHYQATQELERKAEKEQRVAHDEALKELWANPGIDRTTVHGLMIDAGSTGSRLHVYEWAPRVLRSEQDIQQAVSGNKLSFPGTESRWTDRLRPGLSSFANLPDELLKPAIAEYLQPLLDFASTVLHAKQAEFGNYPIFLRATAGMRTLSAIDRARVMGAVRDLFHNNTYCPFYFEDEQARVLSGEEESIFDWAGVNFLTGSLLEQSEGAGTVVNPRQTHGALDLGGASTQISFYEPTEDIMSNLFKLQIGQAKHWNVYAHSFLYYGMNEAINRFQARLAAGKSADERLISGIDNPCLPGGAKVQIRTDIHVDENGNETWDYNQTYPSGNGFYQAVLKNDGGAGDFEQCMELTKGLLHLEKNSWCDFAHAEDCSLAGIYQPQLPTQSDSFGEFLAFSNYYHVWKFLKLPERATLAELQEATRQACSLSAEELSARNNGKIEDEDELNSYCFRSVYAFQLLHNGYGFQLDDTIRATNVINGHKVGWALGAMLYEINTMPWRHALEEPADEEFDYGVRSDTVFLLLTALGMVAILAFLLGFRRGTNVSRRYQYEPIKEIAV